MNKIVIHIGPHKTGSTFLQKMFYENASTFLKDYNIFYPINDLIPPRHYGHHQLLEIIKSRNTDILKPFLNECSNYNCTVISSEDLSKLDELDLEFLKAQLSNFSHIEIIFFWRRITGLIHSIWQEMIKHGSWEPFPEYLTRNIFSQTTLFDLYYGDTLSRFLRSYDRKSFTIVDYDDSKKTNKGIFGTFLGILGIKDYSSILIPKEIINQSFSSVDTEFVRGLNSFFQESRGETIDHSIRVKYEWIMVRKRDELFENLEHIFSKHKEEIYLSNDHLIFKEQHLKMIQQYEDRIYQSDYKVNSNSIKKIEFAKSTIQYDQDYKRSVSYLADLIEKLLKNEN